METISALLAIDAGNLPETIVVIWDVIIPIMM